MIWKWFRLWYCVFSVIYVQAFQSEICQYLRRFSKVISQWSYSCWGELDWSTVDYSGTYLFACGPWQGCFDLGLKLMFFFFCLFCLYFNIFFLLRRLGSYFFCTLFTRFLLSNIIAHWIDFCCVLCLFFVCCLLNKNVCCFHLLFITWKK